MRYVNVRRFGRLTLGALALVGVLAGCASSQRDVAATSDDFGEVNDPFETVNRLVFSANLAVDTLILQPVAVTYRDLMWSPIQNNIHNLLVNLRLPLTFVNSILQGNFSHAEQTAGRFVSNMLLLWMGDVGPTDSQVEDFGQTLAVWGVEGEGPYLMLPLLGPSNLRDGVGIVADIFLDPLGLPLGSEVATGRYVGGAVDSRSRNVDELRALEASSLDYYATVRSLYRQQRRAKINNSTEGYDQPAPTISIDGFSITGDEEASTK